MVRHFIVISDIPVGWVPMRSSSSVLVLICTVRFTSTTRLAFSHQLYKIRVFGVDVLMMSDPVVVSVPVRHDFAMDITR
jgi:hypothetical protein